MSYFLWKEKIFIWRDIHELSEKLENVYVMKVDTLNKFCFCFL